jgi:viroplasmin and RNaseH domain-containing protein
MITQDFEVECCFMYRREPFYVPVLRTGLLAKDLARLVRTRLDLEGCADVYICNPISRKPIHGKAVVKPGDAVRVWIVAPGHNIHRRECLKSTVVQQTFAAESAGADMEDDDENGYDYDASGKPGSGGISEDMNDVDAEAALDLVSDDMAFYAVRKGAEIGIFSSKADLARAIRGFPGAEYETFASLTEATKFMNNKLGLRERDLMSAGSRARHPPKSSAVPAIIDDVTDDRARVHASDALMALDIVVDSCLCPKGGATAIIMLYPSSMQKLERKVFVQMPTANTSSRAEVTSALAALQQAVHVPCYLPKTTLVRVYSSSTYATNCINEYSKFSVDARINADVLAELSSVLKEHKVLAYWTPTTAEKTTEAKRFLTAFRLHGRTEGAPIVTVTPTR